jgi:hypothetical protein
MPKYTPEPDEIADDGFYDDEEDDFDEDLSFDCGERPDGGCDFAGSEYCDWMCPYH